MVIEDHLRLPLFFAAIFFLFAATAHKSPAITIVGWLLGVALGLSALTGRLPWF